ncbi:MAG: Translation initiation factor IF-2 [Candidatus Uhrbacteria bacterium GW2011_GWF2_39_13]|uniref:Translation initiation factor IF-2 n=1 Tax=Candidatus Uhrbacteria bacterium GW2011_GWF2_39_13 TaxID=1618995 RepID=A0A0G0Q181_9BACT|nr:MAG: Translation initiation factor IF-2 [Candidatus Uhrbacteria bacterium GW2011_GWF2_39_13]HAU66658.1 translation initiation factor IF-2 [Candidatus Uhrbacteria bacterium]
MNITELARRLRVHPEELRNKLPELGFSVGKKAIKIDTRQAQNITEAWNEMRRKERLAEKVQQQKTLTSRRDIPDSERQSILLPSVMTVRDFASVLNMPVPRVMQELMRNGILAVINERIDFDTASILAEDLGFKAQKEEGNKETDTEGVDKIRNRAQTEDPEHLQRRPPVIVVMGHVDHGKTKLLDAIRQTNVIDTEAGGITQHIGAYQVERKGKQLTFIDTPGHEAFTVMRSRGAKVADIAILVVAVDDGVQPQTKEAIDIIKSAHLPFVVALNKIDREGANIDKVKTQLSELDVIPEDWGGKIVMVPLSAKTGQHVEELLDVLLIVEEMEKEHIVANPNARAIGTVIESNLNPGTGPVATVLVQSGTLRVGDDLGVRSLHYGRVRAMQNWKGEDLKESTPSTPAKIIGWKLAPTVGDVMEVPVDVKELKKIKSTDFSLKATEEVASIKHITKESEEGQEDVAKQVVNLIIRADVLGSLEAILGMFDKIQHPQVGVKVIQKGLGNITDADINTAEASHAIVIGFNVRPGGGAEELARDKSVDLRQYKIIYKLFEDVIEELKKRLPSETVIEEQGRFEVLKNFKKTDHGWIVGGRVKGEKITRGAKLRISRNGEYVGEGSIESLQLGRSELKEAHAGQEIGMSYKGKTKPEEGDFFEVYTEDRINKELKIEGISLR